MESEELHALNRRYVAASSAADGTYYRWAKRSGVTLHTLDLLYALDDGLPHSQKQICQDWLIPKTSLNTVVRSCREAGLLTTEPMPGSPRQLQLCLTPAGMAYARRTLEELYALENQAMAETVEHFGPAFVEAVELYCSRFRAALENNLKKDDNSP